MTRIIPFEELPTADLIVDAVYESSADGQIGGESVSRLLPGTGNMGGFRVSGRADNRNWVVLFTTGEDPDWPDVLDTNTGRFDYFGDNKTPGHEIHETPRGGNKVLRDAFDRLHSAAEPRVGIPPFFVFKKYPTASGARSVQFKGLAVPGFPGIAATKDLIAVWKTSSGERFQNYLATFSILDVPVIKRAWIDDLAAGNALTENTPDAFREWMRTGHYQNLAAEPTTIIRSPEEQTPETPLQRQVLGAVYEHFKEHPIAFEAFAAAVFKFQDDRVIIDEITRGSVDGGRDAFGRYLLGLVDDPVYAEFSLEAKCYRPGLNGQSANTVGVREVARLISRIRHRQFGVLVTTSVIARQAYQEVREDRHPIIFISGKDIAVTLINAGKNSQELVERYLHSEFPL